MNLTLSEQWLIPCLRAVDPRTPWGSTIQIVLDSESTPMFRKLVKDLKSQAKDDAETAKKILGEECFEKLITL